MEKALIYNLQFFGGRGASSSAGSSSGAGSITSTSVKELSDSDLRILDGDLGKIINAQNDRLATLAAQNSPTKMPREYYNIQAVKAEYTSQRRIVANEISRRKQNTSTNATKKGVNGFGERTTREITSGTYERARKRLDKQVKNWIGAR